MSLKNRRLAGLVAGAVAAAALAAPSAQAGVLVASASCEESPSSQVFLPWLDVANYFLAPGGDFESGAAGWSLTGGAGTVAGNEPWNVVGADDASSLRLPAGSSATSPVVCVGVEHPTIRLFARSSGASVTSALRVDVTFEDSTGATHDLTIGRVGAGGWSPTPVYIVTANLLALLPGQHTPVTFRFTPEGTGDWQIDDVHVDPYGRY